MKTSFSTLGCPGWTWDDIVTTAKDLGFDGIEIRGIENELFVPAASCFSETNLSNTRARLERLGLSIPCLTSASCLFDKENIEKHLQEGREYIDLAEKLGTPFVRVLGDRNPEPEGAIDDGYVAENLSLLAEYACSKKAVVLVETNGVYADSSRLAKVVERVDSDGLGVLWDMHHPYRYRKEPLKDTYEALKTKIKHVHIKDSILEQGKTIYKMLGCGDIPVRDGLELLERDEYTGYVSLEWVKRWCMELEEPGVVFSQFINYIRDTFRK